MRYNICVQSRQQVDIPASDVDKRKNSGITDDDLMNFGKTIGLPAEFCRKTIARTNDVVSRWLEYASKCGISEERAAEIQSGIREGQNRIDGRYVINDLYTKTTAFYFQYLFDVMKKSIINKRFTEHLRCKFAVKHLFPRMNSSQIVPSLWTIYDFKICHKLGRFAEI